MFLPFKWLGRFLARREKRFLDLLVDLPRVPAPCGEVTVDGAPAPHACAHRFIEGRPLGPGERLGDHFFPELKDLLREIHGLGIAYNDLNKQENILVGDDGHPYLVDFQISFHLSGRLGKSWPVRSLLGLLQRADSFHLLKHHSEYRPDQCMVFRRDIKRMRPWWVRLWGTFFDPVRKTRRRLLIWLRVRSGKGLASTEVEPEVALRRVMDA